MMPWSMGGADEAKAWTRAWVVAFTPALVLGCVDASVQGGSGNGDEGSDFGVGEVSVGLVEINQGTRVDVAVDGVAIDPEARTSALYTGRDAWLGVHVEVSEDWAPRSLEARLSLATEFESWTLSQTRFVSTSADAEASVRVQDDPEGSFWFVLDAAAGQTDPGLRYAVELFEADGTPLAAAGSEGFEQAGFEAKTMGVELVVVPVRYAENEPGLDGGVLDDLLDGFYERNPITELEVTVHEPVEFDGNLFELGLLLPWLGELRASEGAAPQVYYHALIDVGEPTLGGLRGIAGIAGDQPGDDVDRVAATVLWSGNPGLSTVTFTHEMGHAQGLVHVECPGAAPDGVDGSYPHADGLIGARGVGLLRADIFAADGAYDYMSYCAPRWVSDFTWGRCAERIELLSSWPESPPPSAGLGERVLMGLITPQGRERWWWMPSAGPSSSASRAAGPDRLELVDVDDVRHELPSTRTWLSDERSQWIRVSVPAELAERGGTWTRVRGELRAPVSLGR